MIYAICVKLPLDYSSLDKDIHPAKETVCYTEPPKDEPDQVGPRDGMATTMRCHMRCGCRESQATCEGESVLQRICVRGFVYVCMCGCGVFRQCGRHRDEGIDNLERRMFVIS